MQNTNSVEIFNLLHDGDIVHIQGSVPGDIIFVVDCDYLRERIADPGEYFLVKIKQCTAIRYEPDEPGENIIHDLMEIKNLYSVILSAESVNSEIVVYTCSGRIIFTCDSVSILTNEHTTLRIEDLERIAAAYWNELNNYTFAARLISICESLVEKKENIPESLKQSVDLILNESGQDNDELILKTKDALMDFIEKPKQQTSLDTLKKCIEQLKNKFEVG